MFAFTVVYGLSCILMFSQYMLCRTLKIAKNGLDVEKIRKNIMPAKQQIALQRRMSACVTIGGADSIDAAPRSRPSIFQKKFTEQMMSMCAGGFGDDSQESRADGGLAILRQFKPKLNQVCPVPGFSDSPDVKKGKRFSNQQDSTGNQAFSGFRKKNTDQENPQFQTKEPSEATDANRQFRSKKVIPGESSESDVSGTLDRSGVCSESMNNSSMEADSTYSLHSVVKKGYNSISKILDKKKGGFEEVSLGRRWTGNDPDGLEIEGAGKEENVVKSGIMLSPQKVVDANPEAESESRVQSDSDESGETDNSESGSGETDSESGETDNSESGSGETDSDESDNEESEEGANGNDTSIIPDDPQSKKRLKTQTMTKPPQEPTDSLAETERVIINPIQVVSQSKFPIKRAVYFSDQSRIHITPSTDLPALLVYKIHKTFGGLFRTLSKGHLGTLGSNAPIVLNF
jgi:hypothetical protein